MTNLDKRDAAYWAKAPQTERPSTMEEFREEVRAKIGMNLNDIPKGKPEDMVGSASLLAFDNLRVIGVGYPDKDPDTNEETFKEFKVVDLSEK